MIQLCWPCYGQGQGSVLDLPNDDDNTFYMVKGKTKLHGLEIRTEDAKYFESTMEKTPRTLTHS